MGKSERIIRTALGLIILVIGLYYESWWGLIGLIPLVTAVIGWCPISAALGLSTCKDKESTLQDTSTYDSPRPLRIRDKDDPRRKS
ncbi:MAG: DUF2892 domain-containing protein [Desulfovibrionales bacterium]